MNLKNVLLSCLLFLKLLSLFSFLHSHNFPLFCRYVIIAIFLEIVSFAPGIIVITDGIVGLPSSFEIERLLNQLRNHTIMCSFIKVGSSSGLYRKLCHVPHIELMQAIATATFGAYLGSAPDVVSLIISCNCVFACPCFLIFPMLFLLNQWKQKYLKLCWV